MPKPRRLLVSLLAAGVLAGAVPLVFAAEAQACMVATRKTPTAVIDQAGERVLFIQEGDRVSAHVQVQYYGDAKDFSWIVPVSSEPTIGVGSDALFTALSQATEPRFELSYRTEGTCKVRPASGGSFSGGASRRAAPAAGAPMADAGVTIVSQAAVGPYDTTVLTADDLGSLRRWLDENDYKVPDKLDAATADYITSRYYFVALKLQKDRETGDLQPIVLNYAADKPSLPLRLTSLSAVPDMDMVVWVLGKARAVPENYDHVEINEARLDWLNDGRNYRQVVTEAMNEADGKAFVTDYAGDASVVPLPATVARLAGLDPAVLANTTARGFVEAARGLALYDGDVGRLQGFFSRHVPKPAAFQDVADTTFYTALTGEGYANHDAYMAALAAVPLDATGAIAELQQTLIQPAKDISRALAASPYLTRLYTTMSPDEMAQDPGFIFNADMARVSNVRQAEAITVCSADIFEEDAPTKIKLANGVTFYATEGVSQTGSRPATGGGKQLAVPAVMSRGRCGTTGSPRVVTDNQNAVVKLLNDLSKQGIALRISTAFAGNPREGAGATVVITVPFAEQLAKAAQAAQAATSGFGCAGCAQTNTPPVRQGAGEGGAYALVFAGFLGYRGWLGRRRR